MNATQDLRTIPYRQEGEPARKAAIIPVDVELSEFDDDEIQIIGHLIDAARLMNPIFRDQFDPITESLRKIVTAMIQNAKDEEKTLLEYYRTLLDIQNSPWSLLPRKNHLINIPAERLKELAAGILDDDSESLDAFISVMTRGGATPPRGNFYPDDLTEEELKDLEADGKIVNSSVVKDTDGDVFVILNEDRYSESLQPVIEHIEKARDLAKDPLFRLYLDAKIIELTTGSDESRRLSDFTWVRHNNPFDIVISTALEVYLDDWKNLRGAACGGVYTVDKSMDQLLKELIARVPKWESGAPWTYRRDNVDPETLPKLKFVQVLEWAGDYVTGPFTTLAQSLPNDEWVGKNVGTVNMVYVNTSKASHKVSGNLSAKEFLTSAEYELAKEKLFEATQLHSALHEIGHTTGRQAPEAEGQPSNYLEDEYSWLEETRAELFGLFALDLLVQEGVIDAEMARVCYDSMLLSMVMSMKFDPVQAHTKARNGMFHAFEDAGAIKRVEEEGKPKFELDHDLAPEVVRTMLKQIADLKAHGDKAGAAALREKIVIADPLKAEVERRTADFPLGRGMIFPQLKIVDGKYTRTLEYPVEFSNQEKFALEMLD